MSEERIVFFDGVCGLCNRFVDRLLRLDRNAMLRFSPLQGDTARVRLPDGMGSSLDTVVYLRGDKLIQRSDAALWILIDLGGWCHVYRALFIVPRFVRDAVYAWVARNRYRWFGKRDTCRLPTPEERPRFLP